MRIVVFGFLFLGVAGFSFLLALLPTAWQRPFRALELKALYRLTMLGPSGADDGVQMMIMRRPERYADTLVNMLDRAQPGSANEEVGLYFVELVRTMPGIDAHLTRFAEQHPDPETRRFVHDVVSSPLPGRHGP